jgi:N utilization substance protein B
MNANQFKPGQGEEIVTEEVPASQRTQTRRALIQALYQWLVNETDTQALINQFVVDGRLEGCDTKMFREMLTGVAGSAQELDQAYESYLDRAASRIDPVERTILRLGAYEMQTQAQTPYQVVINEAVELAKRFGAEDSHKYINGVLDKVAQDMRQLEKNLHAQKNHD